MQRQLIAVALVMGLSGFASGQTSATSPPSKSSLQLVSMAAPDLPSDKGQEQEPGREQNESERHSAKDNKRRQEQAKKDKKRQEQQAKKEREREKKEAKKREEALKKQNRELEKIRKQQEEAQKHTVREEAKEAKERNSRDRREPEQIPAGTAASAGSTAVNGATDRDRDRDRVAANQDRDRYPDRDRDRDKVATNEDRDRHPDRDRDNDRVAANQDRDRYPDRDRDRDRAAANQDRDRYPDHDRDNDRVAANQDRDRYGDRDRIAREHRTPVPPAQAQTDVQRAIHAQLPNSAVAVSVNGNNELVLRGSVANDADRDRARRIAESVAGSYNIINQVTTNNINIYNGTLAGSQTVASERPRHHYKAPATPAEAQQQVQSAIASEAPNSNVNVYVNNNNQVVLRGYAPSPGIRSRLLQLAQDAAGGYSVVDQLAGDAMGSVAGSATSAAIGGLSDLIHRPGSGNSGSAAGSDMATNPAPPVDAYGSSNGGSTQPYGSGAGAASNVCVNVNNDQVVLSGQAASLADGDMAQQFANQIAGSTPVINQLTANGLAAPGNSTPAPGQRNEMAAAVNSSPRSGSANPAVNGTYRAPSLSPGSVVCVNTGNNNQVVLTGSVPSEADAFRAQQAAQAVAGGTVAIVNQLSINTVSVANSYNDSASAGTAAGMTRDLQARVQQALEANPALAKVNATVSEDTVLLWGSVPSEADRRAARSIAEANSGGRRVVDDLKITASGNDNY